MVKVTLAGHDGQVVIPLSPQWVDEFEKQVQQAEAAGASEVANSALPTAVETGQARTLVDGFRTMLGAKEQVKPDGPGAAKPPRPKKETLLVKSNFFGVDYAEERKLNLALPGDTKAVLPRALRPTIALKKHQLNGIAWFQHPRFKGANGLPRCLAGRRHGPRQDAPVAHASRLVLREESRRAAVHHPGAEELGRQLGR